MIYFVLFFALASAMQNRKIAHCVSKCARHAVDKKYEAFKKGPETFDEFGLLEYCFTECKVEFKAATVEELKEIGQTVEKGKLRLGDIVVVSDDEVQVYVGEKKVVYASEKKGKVVSEKIGKFTTVIRILKQEKPHHKKHATLKATTRQVSQVGVDLIKEFEGCELTAYWDPWGEVWTIGYGTTSYDADIIGTDIYEGMTISQETAEYWLELSLNAYCAPNVNKFMDIYNFNQNQFDALVSFAYNIGSIDQLVDYGSNTICGIADDMLLYTHAGGEELPGLVRRRNAERDLYLTGTDCSGGNPEPSPDPSPAPQSGSCTVIADVLNVRASASTSSEVVALYYSGDVIYYDSIVTNSACSWMSYIGGSGNRRYVCGKLPDGSCLVSPCP